LGVLPYSFFLSRISDIFATLSFDFNKDSYHRTLIFARAPPFRVRQERMRPKDSRNYRPRGFWSQGQSFVRGFTLPPKWPVPPASRCDLRDATHPPPPPAPVHLSSHPPFLSLSLWKDGFLILQNTQAVPMRLNSSCLIPGGPSARRPECLTPFTVPPPSS